jgi:hypothetical protein
MGRIIALLTILLMSCTSSQGVRLEYAAPTPTRAPQYFTPMPTALPGDVFTLDIHMSKWKVCKPVSVYSAPGEDPRWYLYSLEVGTAVTVRELAPQDSDWAMIKVAEWVKFASLCRR